MNANCPVMVANDTRVDRHHGCTAVMTVLERLLESRGMTVAGRLPAHADWKKDPDFTRKLASVRLLVVNGEGTIHHDSPAGRRLLELGAAAREAGVQVALINTGWEANGPELTAMLADFDLVAARDTASAARMRAGASSVRVVPDLSLCIDPPPHGIGRCGIGITDNVDRLKALQLGRLRRKVGGRWVSIHQTTQWPAFLRGGLSLRADLRDPRRTANILAQRHGIWKVSHDDLAQFVENLAGLELLIAGRFHACTLALVSGTPFVAQASNTGKIAALISDAGLDSIRASLPETPADYEEMLGAGWSAAETDARCAYLDFARSGAASLALDLRALAG
jgi:hypothetical protein